MRVKSIKSIYLSEEELKEAIERWLMARSNHKLAKHLKENLCDFEWSHQDDGVYLAIDMDGAFEETEEVESEKESL